ncbi:hypothetical protein RhiirA5_405883 [Rhizophagus irregularis]|nr:hypothetical protein RhiirA5_405883 [Rhizophagus irregularis]
MSFKRRGCILHQKFIKLFQYRYGTDYPAEPPINSKAIHATVLHNRWINKKEKHIYSQRLGISYKNQYVLTSFNAYTRPERRIYQKQLFDFRTHHVTESKTHQRQKLRFERACRAIFHRRGNRVDTRAPAQNLQEQLRRSRIHHFLFLPSQHIYKPIQHVKYHRNFRIIDHLHYNFPIPSRAYRRTKKKKHRPKKNINLQHDTLTQHIPQESPEEIMITHDLPATTIQPILSDDKNTWHDKLGFLVPNHLLPYVTEEPLYVSKTQEKIKGRTHEPGSQPWFKAVKDRKILAERLAEREEANRAYSLRAHLWGTTTHNLEFRDSMVSDLTHFQNHFHTEISKLTNRRHLYQENLDKGKAVSKNTKRLELLEQDFAKFQIDYHSIIDTRQIHYRIKGHTSDDTKELEFRPHKRSDNMSLDNIRHTGSIKKPRSDLLITDDVNVSILQDL